MSFAHIRRLALALALCALPFTAQALPFKDLVFFGDSLGDTGNAAIATLAAGGSLTVPPFDLEPSFPYASTARLSNGPVWTEQFASALGLDALPSLAGGTNYAFAGARTGPLTGLPPGPSPTLSDQVIAYLAAPPVAPPDSLHAIWGGGNDVQDILNAILTNNPADPIAFAAPLVAESVANLGGIVVALEMAGATEFLVLNVADAGLTPLARANDALFPGAAALSTAIAASLNALLAVELTNLATTLGVQIAIADTFTSVNQIVADPSSFGLTNVVDTCIVVGEPDPALSSCANPDEYLFWDGVHPTTVGHGLIAREALATLPAPDSVMLVFVGISAFTVIRRRRNRAAQSRA